MTRLTHWAAIAASAMAALMLAGCGERPQVIEYKQGSQPPAWMTPQEIPATLLQQVEALQNEFVSISGVSELSRTSQSPAAISSGVAAGPGWKARE